MEIQPIVADSFMRKNSVIPVVDPRIEEGLQQVRDLLTKLTELQSEKLELDKLIHDFNLRHQQELGALIIKLLTLRKLELKKQAISNMDWKQAYDTANKEFHDYQKIFDTSQKEAYWSLTKEQQHELKDLFRKASKCCHPDMVEEKLHEEASATFHELKTAYSQNNLKRVQEIWASLDRGNEVDISSIYGQNLEKLLIEITHLKSQTTTIESELKDVKNTPSYVQILLIDDWDNYFKDKKIKLERELETRKAQVA